jgi:hypothetical protein
MKVVSKELWIYARKYDLTKLASLPVGTLIRFIGPEPDPIYMQNLRKVSDDKFITTMIEGTNDA